MGVLALCNYFYRFGMSIRYGDAGYDNSYITLMWICIHMALSGSSLIFHIPNNRIRSKPMIWPEFRIHSILFAYRSFIVMLCIWISHNWNVDWMRNHYMAVNGFVIIVTMYLADKTTAHYKRVGFLTPEDSTMRAMPFPDAASNITIKMANYYYSACQLMATLTILFSSSYDRAFMIAFPIQIAALLMTLVRKNICTAGFWHVAYASSLGLNFVFGYHDSFFENRRGLESLYWKLATFSIIIRFSLNVNKYLLWISIIVFAHYHSITM